MYKLKCGIMWLLTTGFVMFAMYGGLGPGGTLTVNGEIVTQEQFNELLWPKIFFGVFLLAGFWILFLGIKEHITNTKTNMHGKESYGLITNITPTGVRVGRHHRRELKADVLVITEGNQIKIFTKVIGFSPVKYSVGTYLVVKYYKDNINIIRQVLPQEVPETMKSCLYDTNNFVAPVNNDSTDSDWDAEIYSLNGIKHNRTKYR